MFLHCHYVWFLCCLSSNCAFDVNQIGNFHLLQCRDWPPLIGAPLVVAQPVLVKLQNLLCSFAQSDMVWHFNEKQAKLKVQFVAYELCCKCTTPAYFNCSSTAIWTPTVRNIFRIHQVMLSLLFVKTKTAWIYCRFYQTIFLMMFIKLKNVFFSSQHLLFIILFNK